MSLSVKDTNSSRRTVDHTALQRKKVYCTCAQRHVSKGLNPHRGPDVHCHRLLHWLPRCVTRSAATAIFCNNTHFSYQNRHRLLSAPRRYAQLRLPQTIYGDNDKKSKHPLYFRTGAVLWWYRNTVALSSRPAWQLLTLTREKTCFMQNNHIEQSFKSLCSKAVGSKERVLVTSFFF